MTGGYGGEDIIHSCDIEVDRNQIVVIVGPNGAGKSTAMKAMLGMISLKEGSLILDSSDISKLTPQDRVAAGIAFVPQTMNIFSELTVEENLKLVLEMRNDLRAKDQKGKINDLLEDFSILHLSKSKGNTLSGGERRRVEIARSLCMDPDFILLDEPFAGVDPIAVEEIQEIVHSLKQKDIGVLITDHNVRETLDIVDRAYILHDGTVLMEGAPSEIVSHQEVRRFYLGDRFKL